MNILNLIWLLNSAVGLDKSSAPACNARTGWDTCPAVVALLAFKVLLNTTKKVKCLKEVGHLAKSVGHLTRYPNQSS